MCAFQVGVFLGMSPAYYLQKGIAVELPSRRLVLSLDASLFGTVKKMNLTVYKTPTCRGTRRLHVLCRMFWTEPLASNKKELLLLRSLTWL